MKFIKTLALLLLTFPAFATSDSSTILDLTSHWVGYTALALFALAYVFVMVEEFTHFRKSNNWRNVKPLLVNQTFNASNTLRSRIASI
jgi:hypothetical protein